MWDLPLSEGWAYYHAARLMDGEKCLWQSDVDDMKKRIENMKEKAFRKTLVLDDEDDFDTDD